MNALDAETFSSMWRTSGAAARARYDAELARGAPPYDSRPPLISPCDRVARCANPRCGFPIIVRASGVNRRYCDDACREMARYWRTPERGRASARAYRLRTHPPLLGVVRPCAHCGAPHAKFAQARFCSPRCREAARFRRDPEARRAYWRAYDRARRGSLLGVARPCAHCGAAHAKQTRARFCSRRCRDAAQWVKRSAALRAAA